MREGGQYGAVGKTYTFDRNGIVETAWGRDGEVERVYIFEPGNDMITERTGGWYGPVNRTILFEGIDASVFREPESFLQFMVFTERSEKDADAARPSNEYANAQGPECLRVAAGMHLPAKDGTPSDTGQESGEKEEDTRIDVIPDGDISDDGTLSEKPPRKKSSEISYDERRSGRQS